MFRARPGPVLSGPASPSPGRARRWWRVASPQLPAACEIWDGHILRRWRGRVSGLQPHGIIHRHCYAVGPDPLLILGVQIGQVPLIRGEDDRGFARA